MNINPVITEKTSLLANKSDIFTFSVEKNIEKVNKRSIAKAVEDKYDVKVVSVKAHRRIGKIKRYGKLRTTFRLPEKKFFLVKLAEGETISDFNLVNEKE